MEGLRAFAKEISFLRFVPSVGSVTTVEGLHAFVKEIDVPSVGSVTKVEGLRTFSNGMPIPKQSTKYLFSDRFGL